MEAAGITLAVLPIAVSGLQSYASGARTIAEMRRPETILRSLNRELRTEHLRFRNNCTLFLAGLVSDSFLSSLMEWPGGPQWKDDDLQEKLGKRFGQETVICYMEAIVELDSTLRSLKKKLKFDTDDKPEPATGRALNRLKKMKIAFSKTEYGDQLAQVNKGNTQLETLMKQSTSTERPHRTAAFANHYKNIRDHAINLYGVLREKFQSSPVCECSVTHNANLRLEMRTITAAQKNHCQNASLCFHLVLSFKVDPTTKIPQLCNSQEIGLEPLDSETGLRESKQASEVGSSDNLGKVSSHMDTASRLQQTVGKAESTMSLPSTNNINRDSNLRRGNSEPNIFEFIQPSGKTLPLPGHLGHKNKPKKARNVSFGPPPIGRTTPIPITSESITIKQIENLCLTIRQTESDLFCLGVLVDERNRRYHVWPPKKPSVAFQPTEVLSLESLLVQPSGLTKTDRLLLGVQLASTVMQLHTTEWLSGKWSKKDILFHQTTAQEKGRGTGNISPLIKKPFVCRTFAPQDSSSPSPQATQKPTESVLPEHDESLFSLGVILVELWFGQHLEDLRIEADERAGDMADYRTASRQLDKIADDAGARYGDAVRRCIKGLDHRNPNLEIDDFKNAVHMNVVSPLVENLEEHCGMSLAKLLEK